MHDILQGNLTYFKNDINETARESLATPLTTRKTQTQVTTFLDGVAVSVNARTQT